ncbi:MAG: EAL domain-containing protein [Angelakisella sp.]
MKLKKTLAFFMILLFLLPSMLMFASADSQEKRIRVGYVPGYGIINDPTMEGMMGYGYDYLMEIAKYTGWKYEFVECTFDNRFRLLEQGAIDLIAPVQYSDQHASNLHFSQKEMNYAFRELVVPAESPIFYDDFVSFRNMRVGVISGTPYKECLQEYCLRGGFAVQIVEHPKNELVQDLQSGVVDAIMTTSMHTIPNTKVVAQIDAVPFYFAAHSSNSKLMNELDMAMGKVTEQNPFFTSKLHDKYFTKVRISPEAFTAGEKIYAEQTPVLRVVGDPNWEPFERYDKEERQYHGINIDILNRLCGIGGLRCEFIPTENYAQSIKMIEDGSADLILGNNEWTQSLGIKYTKPYMQVPVLLAGISESRNKDGITVAMPSLTNKSCLKVIQANPQYKFKDYGSAQNVVKALLDGKEGLAFVASYTFDEMVRKESTRTYYTVPTDVYFDMCIGLAPHLDPQIASILNKSIDRLYQNGISDIIYTNTATKEYSVPLNVIIKENAMFIITVVVLFFLLVIVVLFRVSVIHRHRMEDLAYVDSLTELSSFARFKLDVKELLKTIEPGSYMMVSMDINNFKYINDALGYNVGNELLHRIGTRVKMNSYYGQCACRMSADLFFFFVPAISQERLGSDFCDVEYLQDKLEEGVLADYPITFSVGRYVVDDVNEDFYRIIDKASIARKSIKGGHTHSFASFTEVMSKELESNKDVTLGMDRALKNHEFVLYLQPKYSLESGRIQGAEALVRWMHPEKGIMMPSSFISMFERNGFILKLDLYMFEETCALIQKWQNMGRHLDGQRISVNLSRYCLRYPDMATILLEIAKRYYVDPQYIEIELTESIVEDNVEKIVALISGLQSAGFEVSIDDFGSGYSSLNLLTDLPVNTIKIDRVFLQKIYQTAKGKEVIARIISMVRALDMATVAEGVETKDQMEYLRSLGCDLAQGFYFSRPVPVEQFEQLCQENSSIMS